MKKLPFKEPAFTFAEVCTATGAGDTWLRTFIQRDKTGKLGSKHRLGRLLFSLSDIAAIALLHTLNASLKVAPSAAWEVHAALEAFIVRKLEKDDFAAEMKICVGFDTDGTLLIWHIASDGVLETFNDAADERMFNTMAASRRAHITIPMTAIFDPIAAANLIAQKWEADDA